MRKFDDSFKVGTLVKISQKPDDQWHKILEINSARTMCRIDGVNAWVVRSMICSYTNSRI